MSKLMPVLIIMIAFVLLIPFPVFAPSHPEYVGFEKPLKQITQGISPENITCNEGLVLLIKHNGFPVCVQSNTAIILEERGWGVMPPACCKNMHTDAIPKQKEPTEILAQECSGNARCITGTVTQVIDGDTIKVDGQSVRFALASAPELNEFDGEESRELIDDLCPVGSTATVDEDDKQTQGSYGRIIGVIYCNGYNLNEEIVESEFGYLASEFCNSSEFSNESWSQKHGCGESSEPKQVQNTAKTIATTENCDPSSLTFASLHLRLIWTAETCHKSDLQFYSLILTDLTEIKTE